jgi:hypothetical protein
MMSKGWLAAKEVRKMAIIYYFRKNIMVITRLQPSPATIPCCQYSVSFMMCCKTNDF